MVSKIYGFWSRMLCWEPWGMCYCGLMGFSMQIPIHQVGGLGILWHLRGYGLSKVWDMRVPTVLHFNLVLFTIAGAQRNDHLVRCFACSDIGWRHMTEKKNEIDNTYPFSLTSKWQVNIHRGQSSIPPSLCQVPSLCEGKKGLPPPTRGLGCYVL